MESPLVKVVPIVAFGADRKIAASMDPLFVDTPFRLTAVPDLLQEPESVRYTPQNLMTVLFNLHPRPRVFITGPALSQSMTAEAIGVWEAYVMVSKEEDTFLRDEPPSNGDWKSHIKSELSKRYQLAD
ncbi:MAG: hypothetical protein Q9179_000302 [Wetmoreana sp. 5 TL-2023]